MKKFILFARVYALTLALPLISAAQDKPNVYPNYVVIGAFSYHDNAIEFTDEANKNTFPAKFEMNPNRNLYYVYVLTTHDRKMAFSEARRLRTDTKYFDTWVYSGPLGKLDLAENGGDPGQDLNPETGAQLNDISDEQGRALPRKDRVSPALQTSEGALAASTTEADPSLNAALNTAQPDAQDTNNTTKTSRRKTKGKSANSGVDSQQQEVSSEGQTSGLTSSVADGDGNGNGNGALQDVQQNNLQSTRQQGDIKADQNVVQTSQQGLQIDQNVSTQDLTATTGKNNKQLVGQQGNVKTGQNTGQISQQGSNTDNNTVASAQNQTTGTASQNTKQGSGQQGNVKAGQNAGQASQQKSATDQNTIASTKDPTATGTAGQNNKQETAQRGDIKEAQNANQASQQGTKTDKATVASAQNQTIGTIGQNVKQGTGQQANVTSGQPGKTSRQGPSEENKQAGDGAASLQSDSESAMVLTKESDKALTDAGRKALVENRERQAALGPPPQRATEKPLTKEEIVGKNMYFHLFRGDNLDMVDGEVDAIDFEKSRRMATYQGNSSVKVLMPSGNTKQVSFVCQVFGYKKQQREFDPASPAEDLYLDDKGNLVIPFELVRMQKGDIAIMYNVFFFKDAAVMRPESRYEVNNLLDLLAENPSYKIVIHGHTNGNATGKIIRMNTPGNFYSLTGTKQGFGSARELSEERAIVIRDFLINSGIAADRMQVKAWGGKKPIHDKHSVRANENVRVEIEILQD